MHSAGVVRKIDDLGRVSIPKELRQMYQWKHNDEVEFFIDGNSIVLRKVHNIEDKLSELAEVFCQACWDTSMTHCVICTPDRIIASSKGSNYIPGTLVSPFFKKHLLKYGKEATSVITNHKMPPLVSNDNKVEMIVPLLRGDEVIGAAVLPHYYEKFDPSCVLGFCALANVLQKQLDM